MNKKETVGDRIRKVRSNATQKDFAELLRVSQKTISRYEKDERVPSADFIVQMNVLFEVQPYWLLTGKGNTTTGENLTVREADLLKMYRDADEGQKSAIEAVAKSLLKRP